MSLGFDRPLYTLPLDDRGPFETGMFGWKGALNHEQTARIADTKQVIYDGFKAGVAAEVHQEKMSSSALRFYGKATEWLNWRLVDHQRADW
jgi:hypothetical protein